MNKSDKESKNKFKLIAMDLDDTLLNTKLEVSPRVAELVTRLEQRGVVVTLATGRMFRSALPIARQLKLNIPLITYQGALVKNSFSGEVLLHNPLPEDKAAEIINMGRREGLHINTYFDDQLYFENLSAQGEAYARLAGVPVCLVPDLQEFLAYRVQNSQGGPTKMLVIGKEAFLDRLAIRAKEHFGTTVHITKSKGEFLEFTNPQANKGIALASLAAHFGVEQAETMAFGDSNNDLEMLEYAGLGVAMGNARQVVKEIADYVTQGNDEDGVAQALEKFCF